jgi:hypothetical protein
MSMRAITAAVAASAAALALSPLPAAAAPPPDRLDIPGVSKECSAALAGYVAVSLDVRTPSDKARSDRLGQAYVDRGCPLGPLMVAMAAVRDEREKEGARWP